MEDLNKSQFILLVLLVTFVTSIATGIMTVSLLQQAPIEVTRNINSVVEKTIETIVPATITEPQTKEVTTVIVKEEDAIIASINKNLNSVVRISEKAAGAEASTFYGIGLVVSKDGLISSDRKTIVKDSKYSAELSDGTILELTPTGVGKETRFILFKALLPEDSKIEFAPAIFGTAELKLGQTLVGLGGDSTNAVAVGRIISLATKESGTGSSTIKYISSIETDISTKDLVVGSPVFDLSGNVVGIKTTEIVSKTFTPATILKNEIGILLEAIKQ